MNSSRNHYELLGVSSLADGDTLHKAFRQLSKELHPDTTSLPKDEAANRFQQVCEAYELLADPVLRKAYDSSLSKMFLKKEDSIKRSEFVSRNLSLKETLVGERRPFSGGELFSLLLLFFAFLISLLLGIGFAIAHGRELQVRPTWLIFETFMSQGPLEVQSNGIITSNQNSFKSTFFKSP